MEDVTTSWEREAEWYSSCVGKKGHTYHQILIIPKTLNLLREQSSILDLGCGSGVLSRHVSIPYTGVDASPSLIKEAKSYRRTNAHFFVADVTQPFSFETKYSCATFILSLQNFVADVTQPFSFETKYSCATFILSLQNMDNPAAALATAHRHLHPEGMLLLVLNHPCFRIPRQSSWQIDAAHKIQYRRINRYLSPLTVPIQLANTSLLSFHYSLTDIMHFLCSSGFLLTHLEEWCSPKKSSGRNAKMEDRARREIPLFLTLVGRKIS
jgi:SAM-dependent methyltransferase